MDSNRDVLTPPIVLFLGEVAGPDEVGDLDPEESLADSVEYGEVDFFSGIAPRVEEDAADPADSPLYVPFWA